MAGLVITAWLMFAVSHADEVNGTISNGIDQGLNVALPCSPASVSNGDVNATTCVITCNAWYDKIGTSCTLHQSGGGGWGWWGGWTVTPTCTTINLICSAWIYVQKNDVSCMWWQLWNPCGGSSTWSIWWSTTSSWSITWSPFSDELNNAYIYAYHLGITTMPTIGQANMEWTLIRSNMAKMISTYAIKVRGMQPNTWAICVFDDIADQTIEMQWYIKLSCQLGLMGIHMTSFLPNKVVTRAEFGTVLSRILYGSKYEWGTFYYTNHLLALQAAGIMNTITDPELMLEIRWYVMLMLMRADK